MIYRARTLVTMEGAPIDNGAVSVEGNKIRAAGPFEEVRRDHGEEPVEDLGEQVLLPGLINAHCHLDYTMMRYAIEQQKTFTEWIKRINALKRSLDAPDYLKAIRRGFQELIGWGTTSILDIVSFPDVMAEMPPPPIRTWWFYELIDVRLRNATEQMSAGALAFFEEKPGWLGGCGLSPHSPYTASPELYRLAGECARRKGMPLTTHVAESREEDAMFREASGPLYDFMASLGRPMEDCGKGSALAHLLGNGLIGPDWLLVHMNQVTDSDFDQLARMAPEERPHIVHCPRSHGYFNHDPFPYRRFHEIGMPVSLGTDSVASNWSLNLFAEMRAVKENEAWITAEELLRAVTVNPARALKKGQLLGCLRPGAFADLLALPFAGAKAEAYEAIVDNRRRIEWMLVNGERKFDHLE